MHIYMYRLAHIYIYIDSHKYANIVKKQNVGPEKLQGQIIKVVVLVMFAWRPGNSRLSNALSIVELLVHMDCEGCEKRVRGAISKIDGVDTVEIDMEKQKVTVTGYVDQRKVLKTVRRTGLKAELWPFPYDCEYYPYASQYLDVSTFKPSYNYYVHGHNEPFHGYFPDQPYSTIDDNTLHLFSDDNPHAYCSVM